MIELKGTNREDKLLINHTRKTLPANGFYLRKHSDVIQEEAKALRADQLPHV